MEYSGYYGSNQIPCTVLYYNGWYCVAGAKGVNYTNDLLFDGVDVETLNDSDFFMWNVPINTIEELEIAVDT